MCSWAEVYDQPTDAGCNRYEGNTWGSRDSQLTEQQDLVVLSHCNSSTLERCFSLHVQSTLRDWNHVIHREYSACSKTEMLVLSLNVDPILRC
jgi:hypothetical protein